MPNTTNTLIEEFAKHGFHPSHVQESRSDVFWGSCSLFLYRVPGDVSIEAATGVTPRAFDLYLAPVAGAIGDGRGRPLDLHVCGYNLATEPRTAQARVRATDAAGGIVHDQGPDAVEFEARVTAQGDTLSRSFDSLLRLDLEGATGDVMVELTLHEPGTGELVQARRLVVRG